MGKKRIAIVAAFSIICFRFILERNATRYGLPQPTPSNYSHQIDYSANNFTAIYPLQNFTESEEKSISNDIKNTTKFSMQIDSTVMDKSANNFTRFVSYGPPRTASTTQFHMVCVCFFLHMKEHKPTLANETKCYFQVKSNFTFPSLDEPQVMKTHDVHHIGAFVGNSSTGIFITTRTKERGRKMADGLRKKTGKNVALIQDLETLSEIKVVGFLDLYADFFDLSSHYLPLLHDYFTLWEKLRVCCGAQMSKHWRNELHPSTRDKNVDPHPFCGSLDIDVVEKAFMNTTIFKIIDSLELRGMNRPSMRDDSLDGSYCSRYNNAVWTKGLRFNQKLS